MMQNVLTGVIAALAASALTYFVVGGAGAGGMNQAEIEAIAAKAAEDRLAAAAGAQAPEVNACFLTEVEFRALDGPEEASSCNIPIDEFTGYWSLNGEVLEDSSSSVRCNARCLVWE